MSHLCSAHFGKNIFRLSTRKVPKKPPAPPCIYEELVIPRCHLKEPPRPLKERNKKELNKPPKELPKIEVQPATLPRQDYYKPATLPRQDYYKTASLPKQAKDLPKLPMAEVCSGDEVYGFLPGHDLGSTRSLARSCRSLASNRDTYTTNKDNSIGSSSGYSSESAESSGSPGSGCESSGCESSGCESSGYEDSPSSCRTSSSRYPRSQQEIPAALETATRVEPANIPLLVSRDHIAPEEWTGKPEVCVERGMIVNALYKSDDWVYVRTAHDTEGFVPLFCIRPIGKAAYDSDFSLQYPNDTSSVSCSEESIVLSMQRYDPDLSILEDMPARHRSPVYMYPYPELDLCSVSSADTEDDDVISVTSVTSVASSVFSRWEGEELTVLFDYNAIDQDDISVRKHEVVTLLNNEDPDWIWVRTVEGREGFIPKSYAADLRALRLDPSVKTTYF